MQVRGVSDDCEQATDPGLLKKYMNLIVSELEGKVSEKGLSLGLGATVLGQRAGQAGVQTLEGRR